MGTVVHYVFVVTDIRRSQEQAKGIDLVLSECKEKANRSHGSGFGMLDLTFISAIF